MNLDLCQTINLPSNNDNRGSLTFLESNNHVPFQIQRIYYLYDLDASKKRGYHAHKKLKQLIIALSGRFEIYLNDGKKDKTISLESPNIGLFICPMIWREIKSLSSKNVCLVIASEKYQESDYIRNFKEFLKLSSTNENSIS